MRSVQQTKLTRDQRGVVYRFDRSGGGNLGQIIELDYLDRGTTRAAAEVRWVDVSRLLDVSLVRV